MEDILTMFQALGQERISSTEALNRAIGMAGWPMRVLNHRRRDCGIPGEIIKKLAPEYREAIKDLKSDDIAENKVPREIVWFCDERQFNHEEDLLRKLKMEFDTKLK